MDIDQCARVHLSNAEVLRALKLLFPSRADIQALGAASGSSVRVVASGSFVGITLEVRQYGERG